MRKIFQLIFFRWMGWKITGHLNPDIKKSIIVVAPHTSWHDFYIGVLVRKIIRTPIHFVAKKELFIWPFGHYFKWMGGAPIDRSKNENTVDAISKIYNTKEEFRLAITPEGTRKKKRSMEIGFLSHCIGNTHSNNTSGI